MEDFEKLVLERQKRLAHIHEAGYVIAARCCGMEIVFADMHTRGNQCGLTRVVPMGAAYSRSTGLPLDKVEALTGFNRHNFELLARPAKDTTRRITFLYDPTKVMYTPPSTKTSAGNIPLAGAIRANT